ncbi:MAG: hypothetical protein KU37_03320 [Sulfuricurvum sp. PC08-66]|nr:MAG: hypothetical protein KU37_03320 [Sulfuricurvum sp. PC08-66]
MSTQQEEMQARLGAAKKGKKSWKKRLIWLAVIAVVAVVVVKFILPKETKVSYTTAPVEERELVVVVSTTGNLEPIEKVDVGSEVSGTLSHVYVDYDDVVTAGMVLARIDTTKLDAALQSAQATLGQTKASLENAQATLIEAQRAYNRAHELHKATNGLKPSDKDMDTIEANYLRAKAQIQSVKAQLIQAQESVKSNQYNLDRAVVVSPIDGTVLDRKVDAGQTVVAAMTTPLLFTIAKDLRQMQLLVAIDEADVGVVRAGQKAHFSVDAYPNQKFEATIIKVRLNANIVNSVVTYNAELSVTNDDLLLRPGMTASADIVVRTVPRGLVVPNAALRFTPKEHNATDKLSRVWRLESDVPTSVEVEVLATDGLYSAISSSTLHVGDAIITSATTPKKP